MFKAISTYLHDSVEELKLVRWPTRQQAVRLSLIVVAFIFGTAVLFGVLDFLLARLVTLLLSFA